MIDIRVEKLLSKPIDQVFEAITDHANYKDFPPIDGSTLKVHGHKTKNGKGALREIVSKPFTLIERITDYEKPSKMFYKIEKTTPVNMRHDKGEITLEDVAGKTKVVWVSQGKIEIPLLGLVLDKAIQFNASRAFNKILEHIDRA